MADDYLDLIAKIVALSAQPRGMRTDCQSILNEISAEFDTLFGFICLEKTETDSFAILASTGLDSTDFRRLDSRIGKTALIRVFEIAEATRLLINDEPTLDFLAKPHVVGEIVSVPIMSTSRCIGSVSLAFDKVRNRPTAAAIKVIQIAAALISGLNGTEQLQQDESRKLAEENLSLKQELRQKYDLSRLIGNSSAMRTVHDRVTQISRSNAAVLLHGESGTGKELIANAIHHNSLRAKGPFVKVNCAAIPDSTIEAELFGAEQDGNYISGRFGEADGGTIFLDEISDLSQQVQVRLLRVLQDRKFEPIGGSQTRWANVRIIAATKRDLGDLVTEGSFREDLLYRINVFTIFLLPLRERKSDILLLADHFLRRYSREHEKAVLRISTPAIDMLTAYHFPGNVRELENAIESAVLASNEAVIHGHHLPPTLQTAEQSGTETRVTLESAVAGFERDLIQDALKSTRGNVAKAAIMLDSTERILGYKIKKYGVDPKRFK